jgi:hypothetical protein
MQSLAQRSFRLSIGLGTWKVFRVELSSSDDCPFSALLDFSGHGDDRVKKEKIVR